ncbi:hypothetical protein ACE1CD_34645 [Aerosakkonema sp. BLCC-F183]|uniref:hypothetical protein n=1 Tax=Aerosakkonema sp. BLCC-F183 TaxID=3342834 RepID=UPI0035B6B83E
MSLGFEPHAGENRSASTPGGCNAQSKISDEFILMIDRTPTLTPSQNAIAPHQRQT